MEKKNFFTRGIVI